VHRLLPALPCLVLPYQARRGCWPAGTGERGLRRPSGSVHPPVRRTARAPMRAVGLRGQLLRVRPPEEAGGVIGGTSGADAARGAGGRHGSRPCRAVRGTRAPRPRAARARPRSPTRLHGHSAGPTTGARWPTAGLLRRAVNRFTVLGSTACYRSSLRFPQQQERAPALARIIGGDRKVLHPSAARPEDGFQGGLASSSLHEEIRG
jgi:hypothetical protein